MTRRLAVAIAATIALTACSNDPAPTARLTPAASPTATATSASPTVASSPTGTVTAAVYYLGDTHRGPRLYREFRRVAAGVTAVHAAVEAMLHVKPLDPDYSSSWPTATRLLGVSTSGDTTTVDLSAEATQGNAGAQTESASVQQLVHTVTAADTRIRRVRITVEGRPVEALWGHVDTSKPVARAVHYQTLGAVWIERPQQNDRVGQRFTFGGTATVFEATVSWEVRNGCPPGVVCTDRLVTYAKGFDTADKGAPDRGAWSATVTLPPAVTESSGYIELRAWESSAEDGSVQYLDTKLVRLRR